MIIKNFFKKQNLLDLIKAFSLSIIFWMPLFIFTLLDSFYFLSVYIYGFIFISVAALFTLNYFKIFTRYKSFLDSMDLCFDPSIFSVIITILIFSLAFLLKLLYGRYMFFEFINSFFYFLSVLVFLRIKVKLKFYFGFFAALIGFYWIGLSLRFYDSLSGAFFIILCIGFFGGILFYLLLYYQNIFYRIFSILLLSYIHPFGFNWYSVEFFGAYSFFDISQASFVVLCLSITLLYVLCVNSYLKLGLFTIFIFSIIEFQNPSLTLPNLKINIAQTDIPQDFTWRSLNMQKIIDDNLSIINSSIANKDDLVILPESSIPFALESNPSLFTLLKDLSSKITIIIGSARIKENSVYNSTYMFKDEDVFIADKVKLVPFGEYVPVSFIDKILASLDINLGFKAGDSFTKFNIDGYLFSNAICYEATFEDAYKDSRYMIATSNNAWFLPSLEPQLQKIIMKYYARKNDVLVLHATNISKKAIISPLIGKNFINI